MPAQTAKRPPRSDALIKILICFLPAAALIAVFVFALGLVFSRASIPFFAALLTMGLIVTRLIFLMRSKRESGKKTALTVLWVFVLLIAVCVSFILPKAFHRATKTDAAAKFEARLAHTDASYLVLPFDTAASTEYHSFIRTDVFFESRAYTLLCSYGETEYEKALTALENNCAFRTKPLGSGVLRDGTSEEKTLAPSVTIKNAVFRVLTPADGDDQPFYKSCTLIMTDDTARQIACITFSDPDLDQAADLAEFINEYCGWKYVGD